MKKTKKKWKQWISVGVAFVMAVSTITGVGVESRTVSAQKSYGLNNPTVEMQTRECIQFGSYWQEEYTPEKEIENPVEGEIYTDTDSKSTEMIYQGGKFFKKSPITWQILKQDGDDLFLLADQVLDCKMYNENGVTKIDSDGETYTDYSCTWETSTLRSWLNSDFYDAAFSESEKTAVKQTSVVNEDNPYNETGEKDTTDKLFLLSRSESINPEYGFQSDRVFYDQSRQEKATEYAELQGCDTNSEGAYWWLRSPGDLSYHVAYVSYNGYVDGEGNSLNGSIGVRPALHVNAINEAISSALAKKLPKEVALIKSTWDTVEFGTYEGAKITWRVLSVEGDDAFLLADRSLSLRSYHDKYESFTWETSTLRSWLNEDFYKEAFTAVEQTAIKKTTLVNEDNPVYGTVGGNETSDFIYLLSLSDVVNKTYGFPAAYCCGNASRQAVLVNSEGTRWWWLRSPGMDSYRAANVSSSGYVYCNGGSGNAYYLNYGVRPALHLNLSHTDVWTKGEVVTSEDKKTASTDSQPDGESTEEPTKTPTQTPTSTKTPDTPADTTQSTPTTNAAGTSTSTQTNTDNGVTKGQNVKAPTKVTSLKVTNKKAGKTVVSFKKVSGAAGYQIQYAKNKKFTKAKKSKTTKKTTYTIKKLKKKTTYYFRVRAYAKDDNGDKVFGKWSAVKKLKIKK